MAEKTFGEPRPTTEEDPVSLYLDSPYQISKIVGKMYANYYFMQNGLARGEGPLPERVRTRRDSRRAGGGAHRLPYGAT